MHIPLHETADDGRAFRAEQARAVRARALVELLMRATGAWPRELAPRAPAAVARDEMLRRARAREHWGAWVRDRREGFLGDPRWQPSEHFLQRIAAAGLTWAEVDEASRV